MKDTTAFYQALDITTKLAQVKRACGYKKHHAENDAEHSYQVAFVAWTLNHEYHLKLNDEMIIKLGLVHDLVEIFSGDVDSHGSKKKLLEKKEKEKLSLEKIKKAYPHLTEIVKLIEEYEIKESLESRLVNITDKIIPIRHVYNRQGNYYKRRKVTKDEWINWLFTKIDYPTLPKKLKTIVDDTLLEVNSEFSMLFFMEK